MWTNELTETLIDLYHKKNELWDSSNENYKNKDMKKDAWKSISDAMGIHMGVLEIQNKKFYDTVFQRKK